MSAQNPIRLTTDDLFSPKVEGYLEEQAVLRRAVPEAPPQPLILRILYSSVFYLSIASALGALAAWGLLEPFLIEGGEQEAEDGIDIANMLLFPTVASFVGLFLGAAEGIMCRNARRAATSAAVGLGMGFVGGLIALIPTGMIFVLSVMMAVQASSTPLGEDGMPTGFGMLLLMMGRAAAWSLAAIPAGLGQGIALRERKVVINGILGAAIGGLVGGLVFDPIYLLFGSPERAVASRAVGFGTIGVMVGLFVGLVEQWTKTAWLFMRAGPLAGKQFILHKNPTVIGSSPKADIYIFKDPAIEPQHALIHNRGGRFEIEDCNTPDGTYVNGVPVKRHMLNVGDKVVVGQAVLEFAVKET